MFRVNISPLRIEKCIRSLCMTSKLGKNYYEVLGVAKTATPAEIKAAFYEKTKLYHPDLVSKSDESLKLFREVTEAYETLGKEVSTNIPYFQKGNATAKREYDANVLGIGHDDVDEVNDPIQTYQSRIKLPEKKKLWTEKHYSYLRMHQRTHHPEKIRDQQIRNKLNEEARSKLFTFTFTLCAFVVICLFSINLTEIG